MFQAIRVHHNSSGIVGGYGYGTNAVFDWSSKDCLRYCGLCSAIISIIIYFFQNLNLRDIGEVVIVDIDEKTLTSPFDDVAAMPSEVVTFLKTQLRSQSAMDDTFAKHFLRAMVLLFGDYTSGFTGDTPETLVFSKERFVSQQRPSYQAYIDSLLGADGVQYLERVSSQLK